MVEVPQAKSVIPRSRQSKLSVRRDNYILNEVGMSLERFSRIGVAGKLTSSKSPHKNGLISGSRKDHIGALWCGSNSSYPTSMALKNAAKMQWGIHVCSISGGKE